jgi:hypothetical protein
VAVAAAAAAAAVVVVVVVVVVMYGNRCYNFWRQKYDLERS